MTTRSVTRSILINAPPVKVWDVITRAGSISDWYEGWDRILSAETGCAVRQGLSFRLVRNTKGGEEVAECTITELLPGVRLQWVESSPRKPTTTVTFDLVALPDGRGTALHQTRSWSMMRT